MYNSYFSYHIICKSSSHLDIFVYAVQKKTVYVVNLKNNIKSILGI